MSQDVFVRIKTDVVDANVPLLNSLKDLKTTWCTAQLS